MICPKCKAEYRQGFTKCADCEVDLVWKMPELPASRAAREGTDGAESADTGEESEEDPFCSFWKGDDPRIHAELCELMEEQGIPHKTVYRRDHLFNMQSRSAFQIGVPYSLFEKAEAAVQEAYGDLEAAPGAEDAGKLLPVQTNPFGRARTIAPWLPEKRGFAGSGDDETVEIGITEDGGEEKDFSGASELTAATNWDPENWHAEDATVQVWASEDAYAGEFLMAALRENQIHARFEQAEGKNAIFVMPEDEVRAQEIVREIEQGAAPE
jgi:hypothetical protein